MLGTGNSVLQVRYVLLVNDGNGGGDYIVTTNTANGKINAGGI